LRSLSIFTVGQDQIGADFGLKMVAEEGAGFAGFAISGMGMEPHGPDFMARGDLST
jgi:hypothetical protein